MHHRRLSPPYKLIIYNNKMNPKFYYNHLMIIVIFFFFFLQSLHYPSSFGQNAPNDAPCTPFQCGNISDITYPFWDPKMGVIDEDGDLLCGRPGFEIECLNNTPILYISHLPYQVLEFDFTNWTLKLTRQDLLNTPCSPIPLNTVIPSRDFEIPTDSGCKNVTLNYNCTTPPKIMLPNQFRCSYEAMNFFNDGSGNVSTAEFDCKMKIVVPVKESALEVSRASSPRLALDRAIRSGFAIRWLADNTLCAECNRMKGTCIYNNNISRFKCTGTPTTRRPNPRDPSAVVAPTSQELEGKVFNNRTFKLGVVFGSLGFTLVLIVISLLCKRQSCPSAPKNPHIEKFLLQHGSLAPKRYRYSEIKKITKSFNDKLGQGGYGCVYKGTLPDGSLVAIKVLFEMDTNDEEFINEVASISRTSHVNVVRLLGFCYERNKRALVYEYMPNHSLDKLINDAEKSQDMEIMYNIAVGVAKGLEYLHKGCSTSIIHFDIKPQNILLDDGFNPKISDFGLAKLCKKRQSVLSMPGTRGTAGYIAPEVFSRNFGQVSHKSDVYSYGIMVLEMAGAHKFFDSQEVQSSENYFPDKIYTQVVEFGHVMKNVDYNESLIQQDNERAQKMMLVGFWCMQTMPSDRPPMSKVLDMLEGNLESIPTPPKPFLFNPNQMAQESSSSVKNGSMSTTFTTMETSRTYTTTTTSREENA